MSYSMNPQQISEDIKRYWKYILWGIIAVVVLSGTFFQIGPEEIGVITRFGKYTRDVDPGLNVTLPIVETLYKVAVERQQKEEFGFRTLGSSGSHTDYSKVGTSSESLMLTGDLNLADVEWVVQYRIENAYNYLFKVRDPVSSLRDISEACMRHTVGDRTVNEVLTVGRTEIASEVKEIIQTKCDEYML